MPISWRHFIYGMQHLVRARARENLRLTGAIAMAMGEDDQRRQNWHRLQQQIADWDD